jgi:hypothetical protein
MSSVDLLAGTGATPALSALFRVAPDWAFADHAIR